MFTKIKKSMNLKKSTIFFNFSCLYEKVRFNGKNKNRIFSSCKDGIIRWTRIQKSKNCRKINLFLWSNPTFSFDVNATYFLRHFFCLFFFLLYDVKTVGLTSIEKGKSLFCLVAFSTEKCCFQCSKGHWKKQIFFLKKNS